MPHPSLRLTHQHQAAALLYRATFGPQDSDLNVLFDQDISQWFETQYNAPASYHLPQLRHAVQLSNKEANTNLRLGVWWQYALTAEDQLRQRMAYALSQILVVSSVGIGNRHEELAAYYDLLVKHSFGNFRDLLKAVTINAAMGRYLTLRRSTKANPKNNTFPDENYARELMQLFTIGLWQLDDNGQPLVDHNGNNIPSYNQIDVQELARALTGWQSGHNEQPMTPRERNHDIDAKVILGHHFAAGQNTEQDLDQTLDVLFNHQNTPFFIANLLIKRLVTSNPSQQYLYRVAQAFIDNGNGVRGDFKAVLWAILTDNAVLKGQASRYSHHGLLKEPILMAANQARALGVTSLGDYWDVKNNVRYFGQGPLQAETVFNFYLPDFAPQGEIAANDLTAPEFSLLTSHQMLSIHNRICAVINGYKATKPQQWYYDINPFMAVQHDPIAFIELINNRLFAGLISDSLRTQLMDLLTNQIPVKARIRRIETALYTAFTSPEFFCQEFVA
ncbi:DUF1800 domain-containing protein [Photobacterium kishitanii]|uniref:DUF1800 domain-containing protein n=1 Tax=Photobacterium kishitanii TaxID=318456 RepID=UPI000D17BBA6|nr:DUF1800 domain-containing protein [Photobacterium kishitanii]PSW62762.1 DUF1800 domain-containing protein [Photobacterium kishitanii]